MNDLNHEPRSQLVPEQGAPSAEHIAARLFNEYLLTNMRVLYIIFIYIYIKAGPNHYLATKNNYYNYIYTQLQMPIFI